VGGAQTQDNKVGHDASDKTVIPFISSNSNVLMITLIN